ncbi:hypothetical protein [uncultured Devosia sp.]|uniref:hypothetical protein n=1 Tax=uncultured Devosia sp. TaxID=211434 RepID=UPI0035CB9DD5
MTTREQEFKRRFAAVLLDLQQHGIKDPVAMMLLGSLASDLSRDFKAANWTQAKQAMSSASYNTLLARLQTEGNAHVAAGRDKHSYAIQALAMSLVARTQQADPDMVTGAHLLDTVINSAVTAYRKQPKAG